jgi:hypothetical protein
MEYGFNLEIAEKLSVNEAIFLKNIGFWIAKNTCNKKHFKDGHYWTYNSIVSFKALFPFWTEKQIYTIIQKLLDKKIIKKGNFNKIGYDRTLWYTIIDKKVYSICVKPILPKSKMDITNESNRLPENVKPIPDINTDIITDNKPDKKKKEKPVKHKHGEYKHVQLTDDQFNNLVEMLGENGLQYWIKKVDEYLELNPKKSYGNHLLVIKNWSRRNGKDQQSNAESFKESGGEIRKGESEKLSNTSTEITIG